MTNLEVVNMWGDILISLGTGILEAGFTNYIKAKERKELQDKLNSTIKSEFIKYADSSIDTDEFYYVISSYKFKELLKKLFCSLEDSLGHNEYVNTVIDYIEIECPHAKRSDIRDFFKKVVEIYIAFLNKLIEKEPELNAMFQRLNLSNRFLISKLSERVDELIRYIDSTQNTTSPINDDVIKEYHHVCEKEYGIVRFTGISGAERKAEQKISKIYIKNTFSFYDVSLDGNYSTRINNSNPVKLENIFDFGNKVVIVGGAGYGKTTTLNYLFCNYEKIFNLFPLKIKIDLKEYAEDISTNKSDVLNCIIRQFIKKSKCSSSSYESVESFIADFLNQGKCLVIFDALDEIATQNARDIVRTEIANFCELYYLNKFIISSREVGYLKNKFDSSFIHLRINKFATSQIKSYCKNWYKIYKNRNYNKKEFEKFWEEFSKEAEKARCIKLIENPIILILALVVFDFDEKLPNRRIKFYKKCIETFLFEREERRGTIDKLNKNTRNILGMDSVLPSVAHYKYQKTNENVSYKFTNSQLKESIFNAIEVSSVIDWTSAVNEYIKYLIERAELVGEVDDDVYDFAHKTFYEYFLSLYFSMQLESNKLQRQLTKWIGDANNHELAQLIIEKIIESGDIFKQKEILEYLFNSIDSKEKFSKRRDILFVITELYNGNILPPKYYDRYYMTLLSNGDLVYCENERELNKSIESIKYEDLELEMVYNQYVKDIPTFSKTLESLLYLNKTLKKKLLHNFFDKELLEKSLILLEYADIVKEHKKSYPNPEEALNYFFDENFGALKQCPLLVVSSIQTILLNESQDYINFEKLLFTELDKNEYFYKYSTPKKVFKLANMAMNSSEGFALFLLSIIVCSYTKTNVILGYIIDLNINEENKENIKEIQTFAFWLWDLLNKDSDFEMFKDSLKTKNIYNEKYENIYQQSYDLYHRFGIGYKDHRIMRLVEKKKVN